MISESECSKAAETRDDIKTLYEWRLMKRMKASTISRKLGISEEWYLHKEEHPLKFTLGEFLRACYLLGIRTGDVDIFPNGSKFEIPRRTKGE